MFGRRLFSQLFSFGDRFSEAELRRLHKVLLNNPVVDCGNRDVVVEALRSIAEIVIWYDVQFNFH